MSSGDDNPASGDDGRPSMVKGGAAAVGSLRDLLESLRFDMDAGGNGDAEEYVEQYMNAMGGGGGGGGQHPGGGGPGMNGDYEDEYDDDERGQVFGEEGVEDDKENYRHAHGSEGGGRPRRGGGRSSQVEHSGESGDDQYAQQARYNNAASRRQTGRGQSSGRGGQSDLYASHRRSNPNVHTDDEGFVHGPASDDESQSYSSAGDSSRSTHTSDSDSVK